MAKSTHITPAKKHAVPVGIPPEHTHWIKAFYITLLLFTGLVMYSGYGTGFHSDEMDMNAYGKANWNYLSSLGKDTSYRRVVLEDSTVLPAVIKTYGGFFELVYNCVLHTAGPFFGGEYTTRHLLCQLMGMLAIWIAGLITVTLTKRYLYGLCCIILLYLSPTYFGHMLFNTKDIPFTCAYILCIYGLILFIKQQDKPRLKPYMLIALGLGASVGTRIAGLILLVYIAVAVGIKLYQHLNNKGAALPLFIRQMALLALAILTGGSIMLLSWPFALSSPFENIQYALQVASKFPQRIPFVFEGEFIDSLTIPSHYLPKWMGITIPVMVLFLFSASALALIFTYKQRGSVYYWLILFTVLFPVAYAMYNKAALYSAWRHLLFIYPLMVVFAVYILYILTRYNLKKHVPYMVCGICVSGMLHPIYWSLKNHPFEYTYFNETSGGFAENYSRYETDYWQLSVKKAMDWLYEHERIGDKRAVRLGSNAFSATTYLAKHVFKDTGTDVLQTSYKSKCMVNWNYMILSNLFIEPYVIENDFYPPLHTIHRIEIDGKTLCAIVKDSVREDYKAYTAVNNGRFTEGDSLCDAYLLKDPACVKILEQSAEAKAEKKDWNACYQRCAAGLQYEPNNITLRYFLGMYYAHTGEPRKAVTNLEGALALGYKKSKEAYRVLSKLYTTLGDPKKAAYYVGLAQ